MDDRDMDTKSIMVVQMEAKRRNMMLSAGIIILLGFNGGVSMSYPAATLPLYEGRDTPLDNPLTVDQASWFVSVSAVSSVVGYLLGGFLSDRIGRKATLVVSGVVLFVSTLLVYFAYGFLVLLASRIISGLSLGIMMPTAYLLLSEISLIRIRGILAVFNTLIINVGWLYTLVLSSVCSWTVLMVLSIIPLVLFLALAWFIPESPTWYTKREEVEKAELCLRWLRGETYCGLRMEMGELIKCSTQEETPSVKETLNYFCSKQVLKPLFLTIGLLFIQATCGIDAILYYCKPIFLEAHLPLDNHFFAILMQVGCTVGYLFATPLMAKLDRKPQFNCSGILMALCVGTIGLCLHMQGTTNPILAKMVVILPPICFLTFAFAYGVGLGPVVYAILGEIFPIRAKAVVSALVLGLRYFFVFCQLKTYPSLMSSLGLPPLFFAHAMICLLGCAYNFVFVPETNGLTLTEIDNLFSGEETRKERKISITQIVKEKNEIV